jgi:hypothetical protein
MRTLTRRRPRVVAQLQLVKPDGAYRITTPLPSTLLHAAVRCGADDRQALEQLCRYITRPALANERVQTNAGGQVVLKPKTPWRDGTMHLAMSPLEFMQLPIEWPVCGGQLPWFYVCSGSRC